MTLTCAFSKVIWAFPQRLSITSDAVSTGKAKLLVVPLGGVEAGRELGSSTEKTGPLLPRGEGWHGGARRLS